MKEVVKYNFKTSVQKVKKLEGKNSKENINLEQ